MKIDIWITKRTRDTLMFLVGIAGATWAIITEQDPALITLFATLAGLGPLLTARDDDKADKEPPKVDPKAGHPLRRHDDPKPEEED